MVKRPATPISARSLGMRLERPEDRLGYINANVKITAARHEPPTTSRPVGKIRDIIDITYNGFYRPGWVCKTGTVSKFMPERDTLSNDISSIG